MSLGNSGSGQMDDDGRISGMMKVGGYGSTRRKYTHSMFVHHKL